MSQKRQLIHFNSEGNFVNPPDKLYYVQKNSDLTFILDSTHLKKYKPILLSNIPQNKRQPHVEVISKQNQSLKYSDFQQYNHFKGYYNQEFSWQCDIKLGDQGGSVYFQMVFVDPELDLDQQKMNPNDVIEIRYFGAAECIIVEPTIKVNNKQISMNDLVVQTVLPYSLGKANNWLKALQDTVDLKYNAIHFPPLQQLGASGSLYSIRDQLKVNNDIFESEAQLEGILKELNNKGIINFTDILLNHTSAQSEWLNDCPGSYYNEKNVPHLHSAIVLDEQLNDFSNLIADGKLEHYNKKTLDDEADLQHCMRLLREYIAKNFKVEEFFSVNIQKASEEFQQYLKKYHISLVQTEYELEDADNFFAKNGIDIIEELVIQNTKNIGAQRFSATVDMEIIAQEVKKNPKNFSLEGFKRALELVNRYWIEKAQQYQEDAFRGIEGTIRWQFLERPDKDNTITRKNALLPRYFSKLTNGEYAANNGWIMNLSNVQENFVESKDFHYLRRTIVIWTDLVKLRYGNTKQDSPFLWKRMKKYVQKLAAQFQGFRIDNAHSTPLHVGEYFVRKARKINKDLIVFAELFTGSPVEDAQFVQRMGINALVRETVHATHADHIYGQLEYIAQNQDNYIGRLPPSIELDILKGTQMQVLVPQIPKAMIYDQTHDNESILQLKNVGSMLSTIALLSFSNIMYGSTKGFDELYPEKLSVVTERRQYKVRGEIKKQLVEKEGYQVGLIFRPESPLKNGEKVYLFGSFNNWKEGIECKLEGDVYIARFSVSTIGTYFYKFTVGTYWTLDSHKQEQEGNHYFTISVNKQKQQYENLCQVRNIINQINQNISETYSQIQIKNHGQGVISITREHPQHKESYMAIVRTAYGGNNDSSYVNFELACNGQLDSVQHIFVPKEQKPKVKNVAEEGVIEGYCTKIYEEYNIREFADLFYSPKNNKQMLHFYNLKPGTVIILKCSLDQSQKDDIELLQKQIAQAQDPKNLKLYQMLKAVDLNYILYVCDQEQWELNGCQMYQVPGKGGLIYSGLAGLLHDMNEGQKTRNFKLPLSNNIREGNWLIDYTIERLEQGGFNVKTFKNYYQSIVEKIKPIPTQHKPFYFFLVIKLIYQQIISEIYNKIPESRRDCFKSSFYKDLLFSVFQFVGSSPGSHFQNFKYSMAAGLPHFTTGWARCWGRDTFISFRGLLLLPGLYDEARSILLMFASVERHGLIPNLLDGGRNSRYNNRDSCWWFIKAVKDYIEITKDTSIWKAQIKKQSLDDSFEIHQKMQHEGKEVIQSLYDVVQNIFQKHAKGVLFREWRAGHEIDYHMKSEGFNINLKLDLNTGFIIGGNQYNCLTWMDKMGSSHKSGNQGLPATSRNGAPIEMTALLKLCLDFVDQQNKQGLYPYKEVELNDGSKLSFKDWSDKIQENFKKHYWVPENSTNHYDKKYSYISGMYKDVVFNTDPKVEYHLRPNSCIAIAVAPELFTQKSAVSHLNNCEKYLLEPNSIGIKTLDKINENYISYYDNSDDSTNFKTSHGYSYHNGPEWVWVYGYFLLAKLTIFKKEKNFQKQQIMSYLARHKRYISNDHWLSLPEMTNANGEHNRFSCPAQAWSIGTIIETCYDLQQN